MKKLFLSLLIIFTLVIFTGCNNDRNYLEGSWVVEGSDEVFGETFELFLDFYDDGTGYETIYLSTTPRMRLSRYALTWSVDDNILTIHIQDVTYSFRYDANVDTLTLTAIGTGLLGIYEEVHVFERN